MGSDHRAPPVDVVCQPLLENGVCKGDPTDLGRREGGFRVGIQPSTAWGNHSEGTKNNQESLKLLNDPGVSQPSTDCEFCTQRFPP